MQLGEGVSHRAHLRRVSGLQHYKDTRVRAVFLCFCEGGLEVTPRVHLNTTTQQQGWENYWELLAIDRGATQTEHAESRPLGTHAGTTDVKGG